MNKITLFQFAASATPTAAETSKPLFLQDALGSHVVIGHRGTGTGAVDYSADGGTTWEPVDNEGSPLVLTNSQSYPVLTTYAFRVRHLTGTGEYFLNNPFSK